jgi:hypothetical protein
MFVCMVVCGMYDCLFVCMYVCIFVCFVFFVCLFACFFVGFLKHFSLWRRQKMTPSQVQYLTQWFRTRNASPAAFVSHLQMISREPFLTSPLGAYFSPRCELCPLGGMFTPLFTPGGVHSLLFGRIEGLTVNFTTRG